MSTFFTNRSGGVSTGVYVSLNLAEHVGDDLHCVKSNRELLSDEFGPVQFMSQVHGDSVVIVDEALAQPPICDALVTTNPSLSLAVMVADCIPLLLTSSKVVAAVHVGRRGLVNEITLKTIEVMNNLGATSIHAILGASICGSCYEVSQELCGEVSAIKPAARSTTRDGAPALNISAGLIADLKFAGLTYERSPICTLESSHHFSYRRQRTTGRFAGVVKL